MISFNSYKSCKLEYVQIHKRLSLPRLIIFDEWPQKFISIIIDNGWAFKFDWSKPSPFQTHIVPLKQPLTNVVGWY